MPIRKPQKVWLRPDACRKPQLLTDVNGGPNPMKGSGSAAHRFETRKRGERSPHDWTHGRTHAPSSPPIDGGRRRFFEAGPNLPGGRIRRSGDALGQIGLTPGQFAGASGSFSNSRNPSRSLVSGIPDDG